MGGFARELSHSNEGVRPAVFDETVVALVEGEGLQWHLYRSPNFSRKLKLLSTFAY